MMDDITAKEGRRLQMSAPHKYCKSILPSVREFPSAAHHCSSNYVNLGHAIITATFRTKYMVRVTCVEAMLYLLHLFYMVSPLTVNRPLLVTQSKKNARNSQGIIRYSLRQYSELLSREYNTIALSHRLTR